jgi:Cdc6-like AAA superfamily ATPase
MERLVINLYGAPGTGKSTTASYLFYRLKKDGYKCELVAEYAKDKVYERNDMALSNQVYLFAKQYYAMDKAFSSGDVDIIIADSPLLLSNVYNNDFGIHESLCKLVGDVNKKYTNLNILLTPVGIYKEEGRTQNEEEAWAIHDKILKMSNLEFHYETNKFEVTTTDLIYKGIRLWLGGFNFIKTQTG